MKITLIVNSQVQGMKRFYRKLPQLEAALPEAQVAAVETEKPGHAIQLAAEHCAGSDYLIAVGGDGTLNEILNGCMQARERNPAVTLPVFGMLAYGSANDFARSIGLSGTVDELVALLEARSSRGIDIGIVRCHDAAGNSLERHFFNVADVGIRASVVQRMSQRHGYLGSNLSYLRAIIASFRSYRHMELKLESDAGWAWNGRSLALVAANGCYFGSGLGVAPGAQVDDGQLFLTLVGDVGIADFLTHLDDLKRGIPLDHKEVTYHTASSVTVETAGVPAPLETDGEFIGYTPAVIGVLPGEVVFLGS